MESSGSGLSLGWGENKNMAEDEQKHFNTSLKAGVSSYLFALDLTKIICSLIQFFFHVFIHKQKVC